jgi:Trk K+ transport system NAD-binding subunit
MVASLYRNHIVIVSMGRVGFRIAEELRSMGEEVVGIDMEAEPALYEEVQELGIPLIHGNGRQRKVLEQAGVPRAKSVVLATSDDLANIDAALTARELNSQCRIVIRLFDETLVNKIGPAFSMHAISTAQKSAGAFAVAARGHNVYQELQLAGQKLYLMDILLNPGGGLAGRTVGEIQADRQANVVMLHGPGGADINPAPQVVLQPHQTLLVIAPKARLAELEQQNKGR